MVSHLLYQITVLFFCALFKQILIVDDAFSAGHLTSVVQAYEAQLKLKCVILPMKIELPQEVYSKFPVVGMMNPDQDLPRWMREDGHGTTFDTGCSVIVTKFEHLDKTLEARFKNLMWILIDRIPKNKELQVTKPVVELYPNIISAYCPYKTGRLVSYYEK